MTATATVKGGFFAEMGLTSLVSVQGTNISSRQISQELSRKGMRKTRELMHTLNGVAPGAAALASQTRVAASEELGGKRTIETETLVDRVTAAGDVTAIDLDLLGTLTSRTTFGASAPVNKDGNPLGTR